MVSYSLYGQRGKCAPETNEHWTKWAIGSNGYREKRTFKQKSFRANGHLKRFSDIWVPDKWAPGQMGTRPMSPGQSGPRQMGPRQMGPTHLGPRQLGTWGKRAFGKMGTGANED